jgi:hypothetical protein
MDPQSYLSTLNGINWRASVHLILESNCDSFEYELVLVKAMSKCFQQASEKLQLPIERLVMESSSQLEVVEYRD